MIQLKKSKIPQIEENLIPINLSDETIQERKAKLLSKMKKSSYEVLIIYADLEHGSNFEYLTGFLPRFEEALIVIKVSGGKSSCFRK